MATPHKTPSQEEEPPDSGVGKVVDPTKNVLDLVKAESKYQDAMRESLKEKLDETHTALLSRLKETNDFIVLFQNSQRDAETRRIDQLAAQAKSFQDTIRDMLAESVRTTSTLVSTQLVQIQATFDTRVSKLEAFQFTQAGRSSVADPALSDALVKMTSNMTDIRATLGAITANESTSGGRMMGRDAGNARLLAIVMAVAAIAGPLIAVVLAIFVARGK